MAPIPGFTIFNNSNINHHAPTPTPSTSQIFDALAHPARLEIIELLRDGEVCVCHIQVQLNQRQAYISQHLNVLRRLGLVSSRKDGLRVYYQVSDPQIFQVIDAARRFTGWTGGQSKNASQPCACPQCVGRIPSQDDQP